MEKILSQDEVDALLRGLSDGQIEPEKEEQIETEGVRVYDLTSQDRIVRGRMPTLEIINDRFARLHRVTLSGALRRVIDITVTQTGMIKFGEFIRTLPVPTSLNILKMEPLRGHALLVVESRLIFNLLDCFFGGTGKSSYKIEGRDFTSIEQRVIAKLVQATLKDLDAAWKPITPISFQTIRSEVNPQFATIVPPSDLVLTIHYEMEMDRLIGKMILCLPYSTIEPIRQKLYASFQSDQLEVDVEWLARLKRRLHEIQVELLVELGRSTITGRDLMNLEVGDVIMLDQEVSDPLVVRVQGVPKLRAMPGVFKGQQASVICDEIENNLQS
ncbi:MAG: flagellar motor switch protein FliM [Deltaproteobacteria bacterium]|nr:flagellar motor switch protein FliM [Deltaproteobacteria bacterium]